jgi:hypothetical protein
VGYPPEEQLLSRATPIIDEWNSTWDSAGSARTHSLLSAARMPHARRRGAAARDALSAALRQSRRSLAPGEHIAAREGRVLYTVGWQRSIGHGLAVHSRVSSGGAGGRERAAAFAVPIEALRWVLAVGQSLWAQMCSSMSVCPFVRLFGFRADRYGRCAGVETDFAASYRWRVPVSPHSPQSAPQYSQYCRLLVVRRRHAS